MAFRVGLVGTGGIAKSHFVGYSQIIREITRIVAGCDPDKDRLNAYCNERGIEHRFSDAKSLIDSGEVDIIVLLTPPAVREEYIYPALEAGIHVLVEKPFGNTYKECLGYVNAAEKSKAKLAVSQNLRFYPDMEWAHEKVSSGELGEVTYICQDHFQWRMKTSGWRRDEERLEISIFSIHILDRIRWIAGLVPERISALTKKSWQSDDAPKGEIFTDLRIEFQNGAIGQMTSSWYSRIEENKLHIDGKKASLTTSRKSATADTAKGHITYEDGSEESKEFHREDAGQKAFGYSLKHFIDAIEKDSEPIHSGKDNLHTMTIVDGAYLSASRGGEPVTAAEIQTK